MCDRCEWEEWLERIREATDDASGLPDQADDFADSVTEKLEDIQAWVEEFEHITEAQAMAVENMEAGIGKWAKR